MDFFEHQDQARKKTGWLIFYFVLAVIGIIAALQVVATLAMGESLLDLRTLGMVAGGTLVVVTLGSLFKMAELSRGGGVVAEMLGGQQLSPHPTDLAEVQLRNVVEEMSLASGVPVPDIYVLPEESGINAFAAGNEPGDAVVAVTRGTLESLTRDELQGVIAHEFSHILNGDMRLNIRLIGALNGILLLTILGRILMRTGFWTGGRVRSNRDNGNGQIPIFVIGIALMVVGGIGLFFANLIKAAVSRQREFLADASAVQFTRNPDGIAGALSKIGRATGRLMTPRAAEASHLFFGDGVENAFSGLFATHPPIAERIAAIAPGFDPESVRTVARSGEEAGAPASKRDWTDAAGNLTGHNLVVGAAVLASMPEFALEAAHEASAAVVLTYSLLVSSDPATRERQLDTLDVSEAERKRLVADLERRGEIAEESWLATVDLCLPALRRLSPEQYQTFRKNVRSLIEADGQVSLFEYVLHKVMVRHLDGFFGGAKRTPERFRSVVPLLPDLVTVLSALAWFDSEDPVQRQASFEAGVDSLNLKPGAFPMDRVDGVQLRDVDGSLDRLAQADGATKKKILIACGRVVMADEVIEARQGALLRAVADTLGCPIPPFAK